MTGFVLDDSPQADFQRMPLNDLVTHPDFEAHCREVVIDQADENGETLTEGEISARTKILVGNLRSKANSPLRKAG